MKKIFKSILLLAGASILMAGCSKEIKGSLSGEGEQTVTFTVSSDVCGTKAVADGDGAAAKINHWIMEVRDSDGDVYNRQEKDGDEGVKTQTFDVTLIKGQVYDVLFWADTKGTYNTADLKDVKLLDTESAGYAANLDSRDAFSAVESGFTTTTTTSKNITLRRPFAQLNVIFTDLDKLYTTIGSATEYAKFKPTDFLATAKLPTSFNVQTQTAGTPVTTALNITAATNYLDNYAAHASEATLFMDYFFATASTKDIVDIDFSFVSKGTTIAHSFTSIPFQRNYRTNIKGDLMTSGATFNVTVDPEWYSKDDGSEDINVYYTNVADNSDVKGEIQKKTNDAANTGGDNLQVNIGQNTNDDVIIPDNTPEEVTPEIILNFEQLSGDQEIIIRDEKHSTSGTVESGAKEYKGNITVVVPEGTTADQVKVLTDKSTVTVKGNYGTLIASCAPQTIVIEKGAEVATLKVMKGNVVIMGGGKVKSIARETGNPDAVTKVYVHPNSEWTNVSTEASDVLVPVYPGVTNGTKQYFTLSEALADVTDGGTLMILNSIEETPANAVEMLTSEDVTIDAASPVTVTMAPISKTSSVDNDGMAYFRSKDGCRNLTIGQNVTLRLPADAKAAGAMYFGYSLTTAINVILNGNIEAYLPYVGTMSSLTVNPSGSLTSVSECLNVRWGATMDVDGTGASWSEATPQVKLGYATQQGGVVTFKNTFVNGGEWWNMWNRNSKTDFDTKLILDNTTFIANGFTGSTSSVPTYGVELKNNSKMKINGTFATVAGGTVTIESGSTIEAKAFDNKGVIVANVPAASGEYLVAKYTGNGTASYGTVKANNGYPAVKDNNLYIVVDDNVAMIGSTVYGKLDDAIQAVATGQTIEVIKDIDGAAFTAYDKMGGKFTINGNNHTIKNLNVAPSTAGCAGIVGYATATITVNDLTIEGCTFTGNYTTQGDEFTGSAAFVGLVDVGSMTFNNCKSINNTCIGGKYSGGMIGYTSGCYAFDGIEVTGCTITSAYKGAGAVFGFCAPGCSPNTGVIDNLTAKNNIISSATTLRVGVIYGRINSGVNTLKANRTISGNSVNGTEDDTTLYGEIGNTNQFVLE